MRLSRPFAAIVAALLAVMLTVPASAEPSDHAVQATETQSDSPDGTAAEGAGESATDAASEGEADGESAAAEGESTGESAAAEGESDPDTVETLESDAEPVAEEPASKVVVTIDKGTQEMTVWVDGVEKYTWPVSTGVAGYSTPSGTFTASSMNKIWYSRQWDNAPMPHAIFFTKKGHAIHGTNEVRKLGKPASHGCVRLSPKNAKTLFNLVKEKGLKNTEVVLTGVTPGGEYKVTTPRPRRDRPPRWQRPDPWDYYDQYGYNDYPDEPRRKKKRRRRFFFQPYYQAPPGTNRPRRGPRWFRAPDY